MAQLPLHQLLLRAQAAMNREIMAQAAALGLSPGQPKVLEYLLGAGESNQKAIALHCEIEPATVGSIRSLYVTLTAKGQAAAQAMDRAFATADQKAAADLTQDQLQQLCCALDHVWDALTKRKEDG